MGDRLRCRSGSEVGFSGRNAGTREARVDSKGRVSIPSDIRRSYGLAAGDIVCFRFDLRRNELLLSLGGLKDANDGQGGAKASTEGCGPFDPGSIEGKERLRALKPFGNPGSGPSRRLYER